MKKAIIGAGGFAREVYWSLSPKERRDVIFFVDDQYYTDGNPLILPISKFNPSTYKVVVAIGDSKIRHKIVNNLPNNTQYFTHIHPSAQILSDDVVLGKGCIICAGTIITTNVRIGSHAHLNLHTTVGHDTIIGDYFTTAPGVKISGNCKIGNFVYMGTNAAVKEKITICESTIIGLNCGVVKDIKESGTYVGTPAKKIKSFN